VGEGVLGRNNPLGMPDHSCRRGLNGFSPGGNQYIGMVAMKLGAGVEGSMQSCSITRS